MVHVMQLLFMFFAVFKNLKSSFSEDNMPVLIDIFIENATKMISIIPLSTKNVDQTLSFTFSYTMQ